MSAELLEAIGRLDFAPSSGFAHVHSPLLDALMAGLSDIARGNAIWIALAILIGFLYRSRWPAVVQVLLAVALAFLITDYVAKPFFNRARPFESYAESRVYGYKPTTRRFPRGMRPALSPARTPSRAWLRTGAPSSGSSRRSSRSRASISACTTPATCWQVRCWGSGFRSLSWEERRGSSPMPCLTAKTLRRREILEARTPARHTPENHM